MIVLATRSKPIRLACKVLLLPRGWTRFLERHGLEITGGDWLAVVPSNFKGTETHFCVSVDAIEGLMDV
jgi:hypothetical protein